MRKKNRSSSERATERFAQSIHLISVVCHSSTTTILSNRPRPRTRPRSRIQSSTLMITHRKLNSVKEMVEAGAEKPCVEHRVEKSYEQCRMQFELQDCRLIQSCSVNNREAPERGYRTTYSQRERQIGALGRDEKENRLLRPMRVIFVDYSQKPK